MQGEVTLSEYADTIAASAARILADAGLNPKRSISDEDLLKSKLAVAISENAEAITMLTEFWNRASGVSHARGWPWSVYPPPDDPLTSFLGA